jgi:hypothetical protein
MSVAETATKNVRQHWSERFLPQQNLSDLCCHFLDKFSRLRIVLEKKLKIDTEPPGNELSEYVFKNSVRCL